MTAVIGMQISDQLMHNRTESGNQVGADADFYRVLELLKAAFQRVHPMQKSGSSITIR